MGEVSLAKGFWFTVHDNQLGALAMYLGDFVGDLIGNETSIGSMLERDIIYR